MLLMLYVLVLKDQIFSKEGFGHAVNIRLRSVKTKPKWYHITNVFILYKWYICNFIFKMTHLAILFEPKFGRA